MRNSTHFQCIGFGPAALGIFVAADRLGLVDQLLETGVYIHEKLDSIEQWDCLNYQIRSNSPFIDFISGIRPDGIFSSALNSKNFQNLFNKKSEMVCLSEVSVFLKYMLTIVINKIQSSESSQVIWSSDIQQVNTRDGFRVSNQNHHVFFSEHLLLSSGAKNRSLNNSDILARHDVLHLSSDDVLRGLHIETLRSAFEQTRTIIILGGSHSGFSTVHYLLESFPERSKNKNVHLISKNEIAQWQCDDSPPKHHPEEEKRSRENNRFSGLRGDARQTYRNIKSGLEKRVNMLIGKSLHEFLSELQSEQPGGAPVLINATGYESRIPEFINASNITFKPDSHNGNVTKQASTQEIKYLGKPIHNLYGLGLGFSDMSDDGPKVGINLYHGEAAEKILKNVVFEEYT